MPSGWTVRLLWRDGCQCVFLGDGGESSLGSKPNLGVIRVSADDWYLFLTKAGKNFCNFIISQSLEESSYLSD